MYIMVETLSDLWKHKSFIELKKIVTDDNDLYVNNLTHLFLIFYAGLDVQERKRIYEDLKKNYSLNIEQDSIDKLINNTALSDHARQELSNLPFRIQIPLDDFNKAQPRSVAQNSREQHFTHWRIIHHLKTITSFYTLGIGNLDWVDCICSIDKDVFIRFKPKERQDNIIPPSAQTLAACLNASLHDHYLLSQDRLSRWWNYGMLPQMLKLGLKLITHAISLALAGIVGLLVMCLERKSPIQVGKEIYNDFTKGIDKLGFFNIGKGSRDKNMHIELAFQNIPCLDYRQNNCA